MIFAKILFKTFLILIFTQAVLSAQTDSVSVTFQVHLTTPIGSDRVFISGNHEILGNWNPGTTLLLQKSPYTWQQIFKFQTGTRLEFKFTRGSWQKEAVYDTNYVIPGNHVLLVQQDTIVSVQVTDWKDNPKWSTASGDIRTHRNISGFNLKPRDLTVWLPPGYNTNPERRYPVIYMHDGQNMFDQQRSAFNSEWRLDETADSLITTNRIEPLIIVGIDNTPDRRREYADSDTGRIYMKLVTDIIKPLIDHTYRTKSGRNFTATGGSSAGGLISFMLIWEHPEVFSRAACLSPAFKIQRIDYVRNVVNSKADQVSRRIYIDNGDEGLEALLLPGVFEMIAALEQKGLIPGQDFEWFPAQKAEHKENAWAKRTWRFLQFLFPKE